MTKAEKEGAPHGWTDELVEQVRNYAEAGMSAREIACNVGTTRNAVIGLCSRRGIVLDGRLKRGPRAKGHPVAKSSGEPRPRAVRVRDWLPNVKPEPVIVLPPSPPSVTPVSILELNDARCRWPLGDFADRPPYQYCGAKAFAGAWCPYHRHLAAWNKETNHAHRKFKAEAA
ncbi:GcrA family cell cycle regulator [Bradyrhizobium sp. PMVTL-01]|uniref:GcrA family cell cycle regulator n=1 Tax=Bradyrhizobium sp. PMVTL-01 TaxID=3434999 RepID=UPI003F725B35